MVLYSLAVEQCVVSCLRIASSELKAKGRLSDGTENMLQGIADKHEGFLYLLQQRQGGRFKEAGYDRTASSYSYNRTAAWADPSDLTFPERSLNEERASRNKVNKVLAAMSRVYHKTLPLNEIRDLLDSNGFNGEAMEGIYTGRDGKSHVQVGKHSYLMFNWHKMEESGNWEITAYVS
jgi:hypothetical protein